MRLTRSLVMVLIAGIAGVLILRQSLNTLSRDNLPEGCTPETSDGRIDSGQTVAFWNNQEVSPLLALNDHPESQKVLGTSSSDKWIEINLTTQKLTAHDGDRIFLESLISSGLTNKTPVGEYYIWYKIRATLMEGGSKLNNTYYYLPNVPYDMFFMGDYGIHGTYWHKNFGHPMSHGCVNAPTDIAEKLFYWADPQLPPGKLAVRADAAHPGTRVVIHY